MPDRHSAEDPEEWMNRARSNLAIAKNRNDTTIYLEDLCFNAQQSAEKGLKAVCISHHIEYPYIHDLAALVTHLMKNGIVVPEPVKNAAKLTRFAIATRYPHFTGPVREDEYQRAVAIADDVLSWCEEEIRRTRKGGIRS
jgi:HEPN domain-containing protein